MQGVVEACMALVTNGCGRAGSVLWELLGNRPQTCPPEEEGDRVLIPQLLADVVPEATTPHM